jgi:hypothetical protein
MDESAAASWPQVRGGDVPGSLGGGSSGVAPPEIVRGAGVPETMDEFVDAVVAKIEQRVIDELERRGRSSWTGF